MCSALGWFASLSDLYHKALGRVKNFRIHFLIPCNPIVCGRATGPGRTPRRLANGIPFASCRPLPPSAGLRRTGIPRLAFRVPLWRWSVICCWAVAPFCILHSSFCLSPFRPPELRRPRRHILGAFPAYLLRLTPPASKPCASCLLASFFPLSHPREPRRLAFISED